VKLVAPFLVFATAGLLTLACRGTSAVPAPKAAEPGGTVMIETVLQRSIPSQPGQQLRDVARDEAAWKALWDRLREGDGGILPTAPPAVDFTTDMVIVAAMPTQGCVSRVTIRKVTRTAGGLEVDLLEAPPAPNCVCIVSERPLHVVRLPKAEGEVRFTAEQGQTSCG
jgi:hypothetical protein